MKYLLRVVYRNGQTRSSNKPRECRVRAGKVASSTEYGFDGRDLENHPWQKLTWDSPLLELTEIKDESGHVAFVELKILAWNAFLSGTITINRQVIWEASDLRRGVKNNIGLARKISVEPTERLKAHVL